MYTDLNMNTSACTRDSLVDSSLDVVSELLSTNIIPSLHSFHIKSSSLINTKEYTLKYR